MQHSEYGDEFEEVMFGTIKLIRRNNQTIQDSIQCPEIRYGVGDHIPAPTSGSVVLINTESQVAVKMSIQDCCSMCNDVFSR